MLYTVTGKPLKVDWDATCVNSIDEVLQNVLMIITTPKYSVPLDREFGIDFAALDRPIEAAMMLLRVEIAQKIALYEPRAIVKTISFLQGDLEMLDGRLIPYVSFEVNLDGVA